MVRRPRIESGTSEPRTTKRRRARPTPRWLTKQADLDAIARARTLMVLSVLSGEKPVTTAIEELRISRGTYYQLETRALNAMLLALTPGSDASTATDATGTSRRIVDLEAQVARLEQEKRRSDRLLLLTRKTIPATPVKLRRGRPPKAHDSTIGGRRRSRVSRTKTKALSTTPDPSIPTPDGENGAR